MHYRRAMFHRESGIYKTSYVADMGLFPLPLTRWAVVAGALFLAIVPPLLADDVLLTRLTFAAIAVIAALGLNILLGLAGQISFGHGAFLSVGAYTAANLATRFDLPFWLTVPAGGLMAALVGAVVGIPSLRIKGMYIAIATLAGQMMVDWILNHSPAVSGGLDAVIRVPRPVLFGHVLDAPAELYLFVLAFAALFVVATLNLKRSRLGRALIAVRDHDVAAAIIGIDVFRAKLAAFAISSFYAGVAGVLFTYFVGVANYEQFGISVSIEYLAITIIGGLGSVFGSILGVVFFMILPLFLGVVVDVLGFFLIEFGSPTQAVYFLGKVVFGVLIIAFLILEPDGLNRLWRRLANYFRFWPFSY